MMSALPLGTRMEKPQKKDPVLSHSSSSMSMGMTLAAVSDGSAEDN